MGTSIEMVYEELKELRKEVSAIRYALIPEEEVSIEELGEITGIAVEMKNGERVKLDSPTKGGLFAERALESLQENIISGR